MKIDSSNMRRPSIRSDFRYFEFVQSHRSLRSRMSGTGRTRTIVSYDMDSYQFGNVELDLNARQLLVNGRLVHLERRPFDLLVLLVKQPGHLHRRHELFAALWRNGVIIDFESGLNTLVRKVRRALNDCVDHPKYVQTIPLVGYRFIAAVARVRSSHSTLELDRQ